MILKNALLGVKYLTIDGELYKRKDVNFSSRELNQEVEIGNEFVPDTFDKDYGKEIVKARVVIDGKEIVFNLSDKIKNYESKKKNTIEIQKEIMIEQGKEKIILEKGDKIEVMKEEFTESEEHFLSLVSQSMENFREPSGFPYSVKDEAMSNVDTLIIEMMENKEYEDFSEDGEFSIEMNLNKKLVWVNLEEYYYDLGEDKLVDWFSEEKYRTTRWVEDAFEYLNDINMAVESFNELGNLARKLAIADAMESIIIQIEEDVSGIYWED